MTNSSHIDQSADFFKTLSLFLAIVSAALVAFVGIQLITDNTNVAHADAIAHPTELNAEYFADDTSRGDLADTHNEMDTRTASDNNALLAQADTQADGESNQCNYLTDNLRIDFNNDSQQVYKLQAFLQAYEYDYVDLTGNFDEDTLRAVEEFQTRHADDILEPWGYEPDEATGYVYITTRQKINEIYCNQELELSTSERQEIATYRQKLNNWRAQGADFDTPNYLAEYQSQQSTSDQVAAADDSTTDSQDEEDSSVAVRQSDDDEDAETDTGDNEQEVSGTNTTATDTDETDDEPGFFARLFGQDGEDDSDDDNQADTATNSEGTTDNNEEGNATTSNDEAATGTAATTGVDQAATSVYSGVNSFVGFIFSPTFLLILLGVLILLLIATLLEDDEEDAYADITADDFAKDFGETEDNPSEDGASDATDSNSDTESAESNKQDTKTKSANFDDTPAGDADDEPETDNSEGGGGDDESSTTR